MGILVTGASGGLGQAVTEVFLSMGAEVAGVARSLVQFNIRHPKFSALEADLTTPVGAERAVQGARATFGRIDVIAHLMGGFAGGQAVGETDDQTWHSMMALNLHSAFYVFRAVLPHMLAAGKGRILAIGSRTAAEPAAGLSAYGVSKAGLVALIRTIALETKSSGVTANVILPSIIDTAANRQAMGVDQASKWVKPASIAELLKWLASDESAEVNGAVIPIYGQV